MPPVPIAFQSYQSRSLPVSAQRLVNFYAEKQPEGARGALALFGTPGLAAFSTVEGDGVSQLIPFKAELLAYAGNTLSSVASDGTATVLGEIPGDGPSYWAITGDFVTLVRDGRGWTYGAPTYSFNTSAYDSAVPLLTGSTPAADGTDVPRTADIILGFNKPVQPGSGQMLIYRADTGALVATIQASSAVCVDTIAQCPTGVTLDGGVEYYALASSGFITDKGGGPWAGITSPQELRFTTTSSVDTAAPVLQTTVPSGGTEVASSNPVYFYFDELVQTGIGAVTATNLNTSTVQTIPINLCTFLRTVVSVPVSQEPGCTYQVTIPSGAIRDAAGNPYGGSSLLFSTLPADGRPKLLSVTNQGPRGPLVLSFDREMKVGSGTIQLRLRDSAYTITATASASGSKVTLTYSGTNTNQDYDILIPPGTLYSPKGPYKQFPGFGTAQLLEIVDSDFLPASTVTALDGYTIFTREGNSGEWFISNIGEPNQFDALDYATAESAPDPLVRAFVDHRELWLFGTQSAEVWYNAGAADFPFQRVSGANLEKGCIAPQSVSKLDNRIFWVGQEANTGGPIVYVAEGYSPRVVSTPPIARLLQEGDAQNSVAFTYAQENHSFYVLAVPPRDGGVWRTLVYDASQDLWHERQSGIAPNRWRANCYVYFYGRHLVGDWQTGAIYDMRLDLYDEAGEVLAAEAIGTYQQAEGRRFVTSRLETILETGVGLRTGQGDNPQLMLSWSDDGGHTYSNEHWRPIGPIGAYQTRVRWHNLGQSQIGSRVYKFRITDPVKRAIVGAYVDVQIGKR